MSPSIWNRIAWGCMLLVAVTSVSPAQKKSKSDPTASSSERQEAPLTFRVPVDVVIVNATVLDRQGNPVKDLTVDDFRVYDDGKLQTIHTFSLETYNRILKTTTSEAPAADHSAPIGTPGPGSQGRFFGFFLDDLIQPSIELYHPAIEALRAFIAKDLSPGDQVALISASGLAGFPFSSDKSILINRLDEFEKKLNRRPLSLPSCPALSDLQAARIVDRLGAISPEAAEYNDEDAIRIAVVEMLYCNANVRMVYQLQGRAAAVGEAKRLLPGIALQYTQEKQYRVGSMLTSMRQFITSLRFFKGRKSLVLLSGGYYSLDAAHSLQEVIDKALRSGVTINPVDIRGAYTTIFSAADNVIADTSTLAQKTALLAASREVQEEPLAQLAADTGGFFAHGNNDLHGGLTKIAEREAHSYVLSYALPNLKNDGRYHKIKVEIKRPGMQVSCRQGYYAPREEISFIRRKKEDILQALRAPGDINNIPIHLAYTSYQVDAAHYQLSVQVRADIRPIRFVEQDARHLNLIHMVIVAIDEQGRVVDGLEKAIDFKLTDGTYREMLKYGLSSQAEITVPPGRFKLQAVVRESNEAGVGSQSKLIEVP